MKKIFMLLFLWIFSINSFAQENKYVLTGVVEIDSASKKELYNRAKFWVAKSFKSAQDVVQLDDNDYNRILVKGTMLAARLDVFSAQPFGYVDFNLEIEFKDSKYRYKLYNLYQKSNGHSASLTFGDFENDSVPFGSSKAAWKKFRDRYFVEFKELIDGLIKEMNVKYISEDW